MDKLTQAIGKCPVCKKGNIIPKGDYGYCCDCTDTGKGKACDFHIFREYGTCYVDDKLAKEIISGGSRLLEMRKNESGEKYMAYLRIVGGKVQRVYPKAYISGSCPKCKGKIYKTNGGWACEHKCGVFLPDILMKRIITQEEAENFFSPTEQTRILDGFITKEGKVFPSFLEFDGNRVRLHFGPVATCPVCGSNIYLANKGFGCANRECSFYIWREQYGHQLTVQEARDLCSKGMTDVLEFQNSKTAEVYKGKLQRNGTKIVKVTT